MRLRADTAIRPLGLLLALAGGLAPALSPTPPAHAASTAPPPAHTSSAATCTSSEPYRSGTSGYHTFRIPAALQVPGGALLAFAEGRRDSAADAGDIDTVLRRSLDGGCTWEPLQPVADAGSDTVGNPTPVIDPSSGDVVLLTCRTLAGATEQQVVQGAVASSARRVFLQRSADGGRTWSPQRDITETVKPADWSWYATAPGHAVALRHGPHPGRLLVPAGHNSADTGRSAPHSLFSDDGGHTWHIGYVAGTAEGTPTLDESTLAELPDGRVYINARSHEATSEGARADAYSEDGGASLSVPFRPQPQIAGPAVEGSVLQLSRGGEKLPLLYSGPSDPKSRLRMQVRVSDDNGRSWRPWWTVSQDPAGYSDLVGTRGGTVGLLYETGTRTYHDSIRFTRLPSPGHTPGAVAAQGPDPARRPVRVPGFGSSPDRGQRPGWQGRHASRSAGTR